MNNTDKQLLERAAKAAGVDLSAYELHDDGYWMLAGDATDYWNPLEDDQSAFRLMADLRINIGYIDDHKYIHAEAHDSPAWLTVDYTNDRSADTRRAITMAAAAMSEDNE